MKIYSINTNYKINTHKKYYQKTFITEQFHNYATLSNKPILFCAKVAQNKNYDKWFNTYLKYTNEKDAIANEIINVIENTNLYETIQSKNNIKILDIGCGNGVLTNKYISKLKESFPNKKFEINAIDINKNLLNEFKEKNVFVDKNIKLNIEEKDFFKESGNNKKYDLIIASHVMYYSDNLPESITKIKNNLNNKGKAIIIHHSGNGCILSKIRAKYNPLSSANLNQSQDTIEKEDIIETTLNNLNIAHYTQKQRFKLFLPQNIYSTDGMNLISFLADKAFIKLLKENKISSIINDIRKEQNKDDVLNLHNNMYIISN